MDKARKVPLFQKWLHRIYKRNSAVAHFLTYRIRPAGILLIILAPATWLVLPLYAAEPIFQLRGLIMVLLGISFLWALTRKATVKVKRELPRLATAGQPLNYRVQIHNQGNKKLAGSHLLEINPDNRPTAENFTWSREPGEETRNIFDRTLGYYRWEWLQHNLTLFKQKGTSFVPTLQPDEKKSVEICITPRKRGVITLQDIRLGLPDPFGIFQRCSRTNNQPGKLIVLPKRYRLPAIHIPGNAQFQLGGEATSNNIGQSGDFTSVRDYRPGDPLRHIHWKSWARTGNPIVKEYEDVFFPRYGLILDTSVPAQDADLFEEAVSVAASFASSIDTRETLLDLMFIRDKAFVFSAGRGEERIDKMLKILAGVSPEPNNNFEALQKLILRHQDELTACICIFTNWCEQRQKTIQRLHRSGIELKIICICRNIQEAQSHQTQFPSPTPIQWLQAGRIQQDLMQQAT